MNEKTLQIFSIILTITFGAFIIWLYTAEPKGLEDIGSKASVTIGTYEIDKNKFEEGLKQFRSENYPAAREFFNQADKEKRDSKVQFYICYSFYREGFGKVYNDDDLFRKALDNLSVVDPGFKSDDPDLKLQSPAELKTILEEGLNFTSDDLNPLKIIRERK